MLPSEDDLWGDYHEVSLSQLNVEGNLEGYSGNPVHYLDMDETPKMYFEQKKYEEYSRRKMSENITTVRKCVEAGIMMPPAEIMEKIKGKVSNVSR